MSDTEPDLAFDRTIEELTHEPILGPRQGALVDSLICRLDHGPRLSGNDLVAFLRLADSLNLPRGDD